MANFNAIITCASPAGSAGALQYNTGSSLGSVGPLTNGQLVIGSTGNPPQAATLSAGTGVTITNGPGSVTISASGSGGSAWTVVTSNTTAVPGGMYLADTSGGSFTITLPTSGVVEIRDAKGTFGADNLIIQGASGQSLSGTTFSGSSSVALNAPGNNATILCNATIANVQQVASGVWSNVTATGVASIQYTGLPSRMDFDWEINQLTSSASAKPYASVGTGAGPTWSTVYWATIINGGVAQTYSGVTQITIVNQANTDTNRTEYFTLRGNDGSGSPWGDLRNPWELGVFGMWTSNGGPTTPITAVEFYYSTGTISASITTFWRKLNV
jgi:hypothetical protein